MRKAIELARATMTRGADLDMQEAMTRDRELRRLGLSRDPLSIGRKLL